MRRWRPVRCQAFVEILPHRHRIAPVQPGKFSGEGFRPGVSGLVVVRHQGDGNWPRQCPQKSCDLLSVSGAVHARAPEAQLLGGEGIEGALRQKDRGIFPAGRQQLRLEQGRGLALFVEVALLPHLPADDAAFFTGQHHALPLLIIAQGKARDGFRGESPLGEVVGFPGIRGAAGDVGGVILRQGRGWLRRLVLFPGNGYRMGCGRSRRPAVRTAPFFPGQRQGLPR